MYESQMVRCGEQEVLRCGKFVYSNSIYVYYIMYNINISKMVGLLFQNFKLCSLCILVIFVSLAAITICSLSLSRSPSSSRVTGRVNWLPKNSTFAPSRVLFFSPSLIISLFF